MKEQKRKFWIRFMAILMAGAMIVSSAYYLIAMFWM